jgi:glycine dehydrogenase
MSTLGVVARLGRFRVAQHRRWYIPSAKGFASLQKPASLFDPLDTFAERHIGPDDAEASRMLKTIGYATMDEFINATIPSKIRISSNAISNDNIKPLSESQLHAQAKVLGGKNKVFKNFIGMGYHSAVVPPVILRNVCIVSAAIGSCPLTHMPRCLKILRGIPSILLISQRFRKV